MRTIKSIKTLLKLLARNPAFRVIFTPYFLLRFLYFYIKVKIKFLLAGSTIELPVRGLENLCRVEIGSNVIIRKYSWFAIDENCKVKIGNGTRIGRYFIISGLNSKIEIGNNVLISERVFITESFHCYEDINIPILYQGECSKGPVKIEDDCWIGIGVCIMPGVTIGKHSIIGANSVVTKNIPPYCVAAGVPAKVVKKFNIKTGKWERV